MKISSLLWKEFQPQLRERIKEIRDITRKKKKHSLKASESDDKYSSGSIPHQYDSKKYTDIVAHLCSQMNTNEDHEGTNDVVMCHSFCTERPEYRAHSEYVNSSSSSTKMYAISDAAQILVWLEPMHTYLVKPGDLQT